MSTRANDAAVLPAQPPRLRLRSVLAFASGSTGMALFALPTSMLLLLYFTDVAGITAAAAGTIFLLMRALDALVDLPLGMLLDRIRPWKRLQKFRRWLLVAAIPILLVSVALFSIPPMGETGALIWAYVVYGLFGVVYSVIDISLGSVSAAMTQDPRDRTRLASARSITNSVVGTLISALVLPMLTPDRDLRMTFTVVILVLGVIGTVLLTIAALRTKEQVWRPEPTVSARESLAMIRSNRPLLVIALTAFLFFAGGATSSVLQAYYLRDVFDALPLAAVSGPLTLVLGVLAALAAPWLVSRIGKRRLFIITAIVAVVCNVGILLAPNVIIAIACMVTPTFPLAIVLLFAMQADSVDYGEWRTGVRAEATAFSVFAFITKWSSSIGGAVGAYALAAGGYVAGLADQPESADWAIRLGFGGIPALVSLLALTMMLFYPISDARLARIVADLDERKHAGPGPSTAHRASTVR